jgi:hypothetical protein
VGAPGPGVAREELDSVGVGSTLRSVSGFEWVESGSVGAHEPVAGDEPDKGGGGGMEPAALVITERGFPEGGWGERGRLETVCWLCATWPAIRRLQAL